MKYLATAAAAACVFLTGCPKGSAPQQATAAPPPPPAEVERAPLTGSDPSVGSAESCVDAWLAERKLDAFGHDEGTMYTGGTPLFDERTGESTDRLTYVFRRHPQAKAACAPDAGVVPDRLPEQ